MEEYLTFAKEISKKAGEIMLKYFKEDADIRFKEDKTIVTIADETINNYLIDEVKKRFPDHAVDGEENSSGESKYVWVCDPVDGTAMYSKHIPVAVFSLALVVDGVPILGVVYDPFTDSLYEATKGGGAFKNGNPIHVNNINLEDIACYGNYDMWYNIEKEYDISKTINDLQKEVTLSKIGSTIRAAMCVASGDFAFHIFPGHIHKNCDVAASKIIVEEAGGKVTDFDGNEQRYDRSINGALITNGIVHDAILEKLKNRF